jgi:hypothetical protein
VDTEEDSGRGAYSANLLDDSDTELHVDNMYSASDLIDDEDDLTSVPPDEGAYSASDLIDEDVIKSAKEVKSAPFVAKARLSSVKRRGVISFYSVCTSSLTPCSHRI